MRRQQPHKNAHGLSKNIIIIKSNKHDWNNTIKGPNKASDEIHSKIKYASTAAETNKKRSVKATVTGFILIKGVKSSESTKVRKSDVWGCLQRACRSCLSAVRFRTPFGKSETPKLRFFGVPIYRL